MINRVQKILYKLGCIAPILITLGISLWMQGTDWKWCVALILVGVLSSAYAVKFIELCKEKLPFLQITIESFEQSDNEVIAYIFSYLIPMVGVIWKDDIIMWILLAVYVFIFYFKIENMGICPVLLFANYHFYKINLSTGIENCIFISKRRGIRSNNEIGNVVRVNENLLIDEE